MALIKVSKFDGMVPVMERRNLPEGAAQEAENAWLDAGNLRGFKTDRLVHTLVDDTAKAVYRVPTVIGAKPDDTFSGSTWLEFSDEDTDVIRSPLADDLYARIYWASPSGAPRYNTTARIQAGDPSFLLGIPAPTTPPVVNASGGSGATVSRAYVYTYVSAYGEEGPPSAAVVVSGAIDATWTVAPADPSPAQSANRNIEKIRIYRTVTSSAGVATYFLVVERNLTAGTYVDNQDDTTITNNAQLQSITWAAPPASLKGIVAMPNGILAGFTGNDIYFCEPYRPHAWPPEYSISVDSPIVGLGVIGQSLVICTSSFPAFATGVRPGAMTLAKSNVLEPCLSRGSIVSNVDGVYYASQNGLVRARPGDVSLVTKTIISRTQWMNEVDPYNLRGARLGSHYYAVNGPRTITEEGVLQIDTGGEVQLSTEAGAVIISDYDGFDIPPAGVMLGFTGITWLKDDREVKNVYNDPWTGEVFMIYDGGVYQIDAPDIATIQPYVWRSKEYTLAFPLNMACLQVDFSVPTGTAALNGTPNNDLVQDLAADQWGLVRIYANDSHKFTVELRTPNQIIRLPNGYKAERWSFEVEARVIVHRVMLSSSVQELKNA